MGPDFCSLINHLLRQNNILSVVIESSASTRRYGHYITHIKNSFFIANIKYILIIYTKQLFVC